MIEVKEPFKFPFVVKNVDLKRLKYKAKGKQKLSYASETPRKDNLIFNNQNYLLECVTECTGQMMKEYNYGKSFNYTITSMWEHEYKKNDFQEDHIQMDNHFSFIIYLKGKESRTVFKNPAGYILQSMYRNFDHFLIGFEYFTNFKPGTMIMFPSFIPHYVRKSNGVKTIAGDILIKEI
jgi:hypothetical protein